MQKQRSCTGANNQNYNEEFTLTKDFKLASEIKLKFGICTVLTWSSKLFTGGNSDGGKLVRNPLKLTVEFNIHTVTLMQMRTNI